VLKVYKIQICLFTPPPLGDFQFPTSRVWVWVWVWVEIFDPWVQPTPDPKFRGCEFLFQLAGDSHPTRNLVYSLFYAKIIKIQ
jgi:hypothetical protein